MRHVRAEAKIDERGIVDVVNARLALDLFIDQLTFERLLAAFENVEYLRFLDDLAAIDEILLCHRLHSLFDDGQVVFSKISRSDDVVKEAVTRVFHQRRANTELGSGE